MRKHFQEVGLILLILLSAKGVQAQSSPSITAVSPTSASIGTSVTVSGTSFGATQGSSTVTFNGVTATPISWGDTTITVPVPSGAATGNLIVTVSANSSNPVWFTVPGTLAYGYGYQREITISHAKVPNTDQINFPALISATFSDLATTSHGGNVTSSNGYDIIFTSDSAGQSKLNFEQESYNPSTGALNYWVQIPTLSHSQDTVIYMFYGNPSVTTSQASVGTTWDSNYKAVWHLNEGTGTTAYDSTVSANAGSWGGSYGPQYYTTGNVEPYAGSFDGSTNRVIVPNSTSLDISGSGSSITLAAWVYLTASSSGYIIVKGYEGGNAQEWGLGVDGSGSHPYVFFRTVAGMGRSQNATSAPLALNTWYHVVATATYGATSPTIYVNGVSQTLTVSDGSASTYNFPSTSNPLNIGAASNGASYFHGYIDDARVYNRVLSAAEVSSIYNGSAPTNGLVSFWKLNEGNGATAYDSAGANIGTWSGTAGTGTTHYAVGNVGPFSGYFNGSDNYVVNSGSVVPANGDFTVGFWAREPSVNGILFGAGSGTSSSGWAVRMGFDASYAVINGNLATLNYTTLSANSWHYVVMVRAGNVLQMYIDGVASASSTQSGSLRGNTYMMAGACPGRTGASPYYQDGYANSSINELHVSTIARSADWISAEYNNQSNPSTFYSVGIPNSPQIASLTPTSGHAGTTVTIAGSFFGLTQGSSTVTFNGVVATPSSWNDTIIVVPVPSGAATGNVVVTVNGTASNGMSFTVPPPQITSLTPNSGVASTSVTIAGTYFGDTQGSSTVTFNGVSATPSSWSDTSITVTVPAAAVSGNVVVTIPGNPSNAVWFTVPGTLAYGYGYQRAITISHTNVPNTDQANFPVLISGTYSYLATTSNGGNVTNLNGYDIIFTSDAAGSIQLNHEIDSYNPATGAVSFWVKIPTLSHTVDTVIYVLYGNSNITGSQENKAGVWSNGYAGVWHFGSNTNLNTSDSTVNANNATNYGVTPAAGKFGGAGIFNGTGSTYLRIPSSTSFKPTTAITLEAWVNMAGATNWPDIFSLDYRADGSWSGPYQAYALDFAGTSLQPRLDLAVSGNQQATNGPNSIATGQWTHIVGTYDGGHMIIYANGSAVGNIAMSGPIAYGTSLDLDIGTRSPYTSAEAVNGLIDEARISTVARTPDWITAEYNNQSNPSAFYSMGVANPPTISSLSPTSGNVGTSVTVSGSMFGATQGSSTVTFNGVTATPTSWGNTSIVVPVPVGAVTGNVLVTTSGNPSNPSWFTVSGTLAYGYTYQRPITLSHTSVPNTDQLNFPALLSGTYPYLATTVNGGNVTNSSGYDIIFTSDSGGQNKLNFEQQGYNPTTGAVRYWVQIPVLSHSLDTVIYMFYGNSSVTTSQANVAATWSANFQGVWHLNEGTGTNAYDSTVNSNTGGWLGSPGPGYYTTGNVETYAGSFNGSDYVKVATPTGLPTGNSPRTMTAWFKLNGTQNGWLFSYGPLSGGQQWGLFWNGGNLKMNFWNNDYNVPVSVSVGTWYHVAFVFDGTTAKLYFNGVQAGSFNPSTPNTISTPLYLGQRGDNNEFLNGVLDDVHLSSVARSADWIAAEYNNQISSSNFYNFGAPTISSLSPAFGGAGTSVTIAGSFFGATQGTSSVTFNGIPAMPTSWSATTITVPAPTGVTTGNVLVTVNNVTSNGVAFTIPPSISSLSPTTGSGGTVVTITGANFLATQGTSTVTFNGATASPTSWSNTSIAVPVPAAATTGNVVVTVNSVASNGVSFTVPPPTISNLSPATGSAGIVVTITGTNFASTRGTSSVTFNGISATPTGWSNTSITVALPASATTGNVVVTVNNVASNGVSFSVPPPNISVANPQAASIGNLVTLEGTYFGTTQGTSTITFNGVTATPTSWDDTSITVPVPSGATTGNVVVTVNSVASNSMPFNVMVVTGQTVLSDSMGRDTIYGYQTINGRNFANLIIGSGCASCGGRGNTALIYDALGNPQSSVDALNHTTTFTYDSTGNVLTKTQYLNPSTPLTWTYTYNAFREVLTATDPAGKVTTNVYDAAGNLTSTTTPPPSGSGSGFTTNFQYNTLGELTQVADPRGNATTLAYTPTGGAAPAGLVASVTDAQSNATTFNYDARGNRLTSVDALNHTTTYTYDSMNRLTRITAPDSTYTQFGYDYRGRRTSVTDANGKATTYQYDDADRLLAVTDAAGNLTTYGYDTENNMVAITDAANNETQFSYDALGRVTSVTFPSTLSESYSYDALNNLLAKTDRKGQTITYGYDALYRLTSKTYPDSTAVSYTYDPLSRLTQVTDPTGTYSFTYDNLGRLLGTGTQYSFLSSALNNNYGYDAASNRTSFTDPAGATSTYSYDALNRLTGLANTNSGTFGFGYDALGRRTSLTRPNGVDTSYSYDNLSRLLSVLHGGGGLPGSTSYTYDSAGNRLTKSAVQAGNPDPVTAASSYTYDSIYQLTQAVVNSSVTEGYTYDAVGNRLSSAVPVSYNYNASNELTSNSNASYTYDNNGNTLSKTDTGGTTNYTWDFENRLTQVVLPDQGGTVYFNYDSTGRRIRKVFGTATTIYAYDGDNAVEELDGFGNIVAHYTQGAGIDEPLAATEAGGTYFYHADGLGSITSLINGSGQLAASYVYDSFGKLTASTGTVTNPFQYTGREFDSETGLYYYRARYYDPASGRFLSEDPLKFGAGVDFYAYTSNNPVNLVDPSGLLQVCCRKADIGKKMFWLSNQSKPCHCFLKMDNGDTLGAYNKPPGILQKKVNDPDDKHPKNLPTCSDVPGSDCKVRQAFGDYPTYQLYGFAGTSNTGPAQILKDAGITYTFPACAWGSEVPKEGPPHYYPGLYGD